MTQITSLKRADGTTATLRKADGTTVTGTGTTTGGGTTTTTKLGFTVSTSMIDAAVSTDQPTTSVTGLSWATSSSPIASPTRVRWDDTARLNLIGLYGSGQSIGNNTDAPTYVAQQLSTTMNKGAFAVEFTTSAADVSVNLIRTLGSASPIKLRVWVDDRPLTSGEVTIDAEAPTQFYPYAYRMTWATAKTRKVRVEGHQFGLWCVDVPTGATITATPETWKVVGYGDSYTEGNGGWRMATWAWQLGKLLRCESYMDGQGGTGYVNGSTASPAVDYAATDRTYQLAQIKPDVLVVMGSQNDDGADAATVTAKATAFYQWVATNLPATKILVVGPASWGSASNTDTMRQTTDNAIRAAAEAASNVIAYMSPRDEAWVTGTGSTASPTGDGNADQYHDGTSHLSPAGHRYYADKVAAKLAALLPA